MKFLPTERVFAKTGENLLNFLLKTELSKKLFSFFKLNQFLENEKVFLRRNTNKSVNYDFKPVFANTVCLLHNVNQIYLKRLDCSLNRIGIVVKS